jgi:hypothetical protein
MDYPCCRRDGSHDGECPWGMKDRIAALEAELKGLRRDHDGVLADRRDAQIELDDMRAALATERATVEALSKWQREAVPVLKRRRKQSECITDRPEWTPENDADFWSPCKSEYCEYCIGERLLAEASQHQSLRAESEI